MRIAKLIMARHRLVIDLADITEPHPSLICRGKQRQTSCPKPRKDLHLCGRTVEFSTLPPDQKVGGTTDAKVAKTMNVGESSVSVFEQARPGRLLKARNLRRRDPQAAL